MPRVKSIKRLIPRDWPVKALKPTDPAACKMVCNTCGLMWDDSISTSMTPAPSGRCPFEAFHSGVREVRSFRFQELRINFTNEFGATHHAWIAEIEDANTHWMGKIVSYRVATWKKVVALIGERGAMEFSYERKPWSPLTSYTLHPWSRDKR